MITFIFLLILSISSVILCALTLWRLFRYLNKYSFDISVHTMLFRFIQLRYFVFSYIFMVLFSSSIGIIFGLTLL